MSIKCNDKKYLLVNIYNENVEQNQVILIKKLDDKLTNFDNLLDHEIILGGDWNFIFNRRLDAEGGNPTLKMNSIAEIRKIMAKYELTDIFRIRYPERRRFTFRQANSKLLRRLDYFLVSNTLQETVLNTEVLASLASDHSPVLISFKVGEECKSGSGYWKFNSLLLKNEVFCSELINQIEITKSENEHLEPQSKWELIKYTVRKFSINFSKRLAKERRETVSHLEKTVTNFETKPSHESETTEIQYIAAKNELENINNRKTEGYILRSKCQWYEAGEKSSKFFLNLEKKKEFKVLFELLSMIKKLNTQKVNKF